MSLLLFGKLLAALFVYGAPVWAPGLLFCVRDAHDKHGHIVLINS